MSECVSEKKNERNSFSPLSSLLSLSRTLIRIFAYIRAHIFTAFSPSSPACSYMNDEEDSFFANQLSLLVACMCVSVCVYTVDSACVCAYQRCNNEMHE